MLVSCPFAALASTLTAPAVMGAAATILSALSTSQKSAHAGYLLRQRRPNLSAGALARGTAPAEGKKAEQG